jgi:hypothetical protein
MPRLAGGLARRVQVLEQFEPLNAAGDSTALATGKPAG